MKRAYRIAATFLAFAALGVLAAGCGCREKAAEKVAEKAIEHAIKKDAKKDGKDVDVDLNLRDGKMSIKAKDGSKDVDINVKDGKMSVKSADGEEKINVDSEGQTMTMTSKEGTVTSTSGDKAKIPDNFPKDIPIYAGAEIAGVTTMTQNDMFMVQASTADAMDKVGDFYKKELAAQGWTEAQVMTQQGESPMMMINYSKEQRQIMVMLTRENEKTMISLQTAKQ